MSSPAPSQRSIPSVYTIESSQSSSASSRRPSLHYAPLPAFRTVKPLPYQLRQHCIIYLEEGLYVQGLNLLSSVLFSGTTPASPVFLPPPQFLALISTLTVHPSLTTRAQSEDRVQASITSLRYLNLLSNLVGPVHGNLRDAFAFSTPETSSRRGAIRRRATGDGFTSNKDSLDSIDNDLAHATSVWAKAQDFWHVVGWAFNCSVLHKHRWERWQLWLEYMVDTLDTDWAQRAHIYGENEDSEQDPRARSIIVRYLEGANERRILRAIFADGSSKPAAEFVEVWRNETKERKKDADIKKAAPKLDIEADQWGDYLYDSESSSELEDTPPPDSPTRVEAAVDSAAFVPNVSKAFGGPQAIVLRLRLLSLLSTVSVVLPHTFTPLPSLYDLFLEHIRPLPLSIFFFIISPSSMQHFHLAAASSITQVILRSLIASAAPLPLTDDLTQEVLESCYLPHHANTGSISDNAKVSLCVETLLRLLQKHCGLYWTESLQNAVDEGITARARKAQNVGKGKAKGKGGRESERMWLKGSEARIRGLVQLARDQQESMGE
ncbi:MAG: hypothetical protein L6R37_004196 [Teloschistes peruensis]|nr:MAG: hypothetical protein L6R37_004196 [Teloschistes peruensis]